MKKTFKLFLTLVIALMMVGCANKDMNQSNNDSKVLVVYFSTTGNTEKIAKKVADMTNADLFEIIPVDSYTDEDLDYNNDNCRANQEQNDSTSRPEIANTIDNIDDYDVILIGHPIWWSKEPRIIDTFVESYDLSDKIVANFCTSGGSSIDTASDDLKALAPNVNWQEGHRFEVDTSNEDIETWLKDIGILK